MTIDTHSQTTDLLDEVDIENHSKEGGRPPPARRYVIRIDDTRHTVTSPTITGAELLTLAGHAPPAVFAVEQIARGGKNTHVCPGETVDLTKPGVERFVTREGVAFFVDQEEEFSTVVTLTVRAILVEHAKADPAATTLVEIQGDERIKHPSLDEVITLKPCMRFVVYHNTPTTVS